MSKTDKKTILISVKYCFIGKKIGICLKKKVTIRHSWNFVYKICTKSSTKVCKIGRIKMEILIFQIFNSLNC